MDKCANHPLKNASVRCKRCHTPVCSQCRVKAPDGVFCSHDCVEAFREFHNQVHTLPVRSGCGFKTLVGLVKTLIIAAVLVAFIWFVLSMWLGTSDPGEMGQKLGQTMKLLF